MLQVTKRGAENMHGTAMEQLRQAVLEANGWTKMSPLEKITAWADHAILAKQGLGERHAHHRVLKVVESVH